MSLIGGRPFWMSSSCREALPDVRDALSVVCEWSGDTPGCPGVVGSPYRMSWSGREHLPDIQEW